MFSHKPFTIFDIPNPPELGISSQKYSNGPPFPPAGIASAPALQSPSHKASVKFTEPLKTGGSTMVFSVSVTVQPLASVMVKDWLPEHKLSTCKNRTPFGSISVSRPITGISYLKNPVVFPPVELIKTLPSQLSLQEGGDGPKKLAVKPWAPEIVSKPVHWP